MSEVLAKLAVRYDRIFSYANQLVAGQKCEMPPKSLSFEEALAFLEERTTLVFENIGQGFVAVYAQKEISKTPVPQVLKVVVINDYLTKGITKKPNGAVEIDYEDFGILPGLIEPDVLLTLQALPGVQSVDETVSNINVRGGSNDQNLILWDGIRMYQSGHFFGLISAFNPYQANKVTLFKNGTPSAFGNSVSSVISMKTEREVNEDFEAALGVNFINLGVFLDTPFGENASLQVSARLSLTPFFITPTYEQYYDRVFQGTEVIQENNQSINDNEEFSFNDFSLRWLYDLSEKDRFRINFVNISNAVRFDEKAVIDNEIESKESELTQNSVAAGLFYKRKWSQNWEVSAQTYFSNYRLQATNVELLSYQSLFQENNVVETGFKAISSWKLHKKIKLETGYEFIETEISNTEDTGNMGFENFGKEVVNAHAFFSALNYSSKNKSTHLNVGARLNYFNKFNLWRLEPRFGFYQGFGENFNLEILGELKSQTTTQIIDFQTDFLGIEKRRWRLANGENIPVLKSKQISLGVNFNNNGWLASVEGYLKEVNGITSQSQGFQNQYQFAQTSGSYFVKGIEFLLDKNFGNFSSWVSYSLTDNNYTFPVLPEKHFPNSVEIAHAFNVATSYNYNDFKISLGMKWRTGKPFTPLTEEGLQNGNLLYEPAFSDNLENYFRVDLSASRTFKLGKKTDAYVGISIWNLLDRENTLNSYYREIENEIVRIDQPGLGLTPNFSFRVFF
ncbi:MAG TPA: TonB-dependent receptor plug domain-containing protein [Flavobacteriaceae bacterium]|nr:TonB-dependent receptor plug domain-containing protein [Flavobacteriaceae bacterium]